MQKDFSINKIFKQELNKTYLPRKTLLVVLGLLGDFDSFEYVQCLLPYIKKIKDSNINLIVVGIGTELSKRRFCKYTKLPEEYLIVVENNLFHKRLEISGGLELPINPLLNLILMCLGVFSPGTLLEVLRGYVGDKNSSQIFDENEYISFPNNFLLKTSMFNLIGRKGKLRPFELASLRLLNMIEVLSKWDIYMFDHSYLTQRTGTFIIDSKMKLLYCYKSKSLLGFSKNMSSPIEFLQDFI
ncbi:AhpC/TSA family protein [Prochlorococcus marinus]|uniref:AhpC/TSA family protein n=1 Tax=Prochlorococcus marinus TaxID=1219 RepID=UPI0022B4626B|nr:AhpC/TSA family protein [Prochlorococcus marinus]